MAVHTYVVNALQSAQQTPDNNILWTCTGTADGISFLVQFWQTDIANFTGAQLKSFIKGLIDLQVFRPSAAPSGILANFAGGTFTL